MKLNFPEGFLEREERCDYVIEPEMKKVWAAELNLYAIFDEVCKKHNIPYFWAYGNLLGAARHKGFIPWDDDIDVFVKREDYIKLCSLAESEFSEPYFLQNDRTEWGSHIAFAKLRNSETTAILDFEKPYGYTYNQGAFLDIFPLDSAPDDAAEFEKHSKKIVLLKKLTGKWSRMFEGKKLWFNRKWMYLTAVVLFLPRLIIRAFKIPNIPCRLLQKEMQKYNNTETSYYTMTALGETKRYPKTCFETTTPLPFEFIEVPAPVGYLELLNIDYGDWQVFKRGAAGGCMHEGMLYDTENSYRKYI